MQQEGGNAKRARLGGPTGPLSKVAASSGGDAKEDASAFEGLYDADDEDNGWGDGNGRQRRESDGFGRSPPGLASLDLNPGKAGNLAVPGDPHQRHHYHQHHQHNLLGQVVSGLVGSSPRGHRGLHQRTAGGTFGHLLDDLPTPHGYGAGGPAKPPPRTHGMGQVRISWHTFIAL